MTAPTATPAGACSFASVRIERSGGLAGLRRAVAASSAALTPACRDAVIGVLDTAKSHAGPFASSGGADRLSYRVHVTQANGSLHTVDVAEDDMPDALADWLQDAQ